MKPSSDALTFKEAIKTRPYFFLGSRGGPGTINLLKGLIGDCLEVTASDSYCFSIELKPDWNFTLFFEAKDELTNFEQTLSPESSFSKNYFLKVCEALSRKFSIKPDRPHKLKLDFQLDQDILQEQVDYSELWEAFQKWAYLNRTSEIILKDSRNQHPNQNYFHFPKGIRYVYERNKKMALGKPEFEITYEGELNGRAYQIFLGYRTDWYPAPSITTFANDTETVWGGSLVDGIMKGLVKACKEYVKAKELKNHRVRKNKFCQELILVAAVRGEEFQFEGSRKEKLAEKSVQKEVGKLMRKLTRDYLESDKENAHKFLSRFDETHLTGLLYKKKK